MGSTRHKPAGVTEIFSEYVRQRQRGNSPQEVVSFLRPILGRVRDDTRQQLSALIRSWEAREGQKYQPVEGRSAFVHETDWAAPPQPEEDLSWLPQVDGDRSNGNGVLKGGMHPSVQGRPDASGETFYCPSCGSANHLGDAYCYSCGEMLNVVSTETRTLEPVTGELKQISQSHFTQSSVLVMQARDASRPFSVQFAEKQELTLGRASMTSSAQPDIDLSPYDAVGHGVSRIHAQLRYQDSTVSITDLDSVNHTYINGQRLLANEVRVLRDGDELRLGRLVLQVTFQHQVRHLS